MKHMLTNNSAISSSGNYDARFDYAAQIVIDALILKGRPIVVLEDLYDTLGAHDRVAKTSVRWAVRLAKDSGKLLKTKVKGIYRTA